MSLLYFIVQYTFGIYRFERFYKRAEFEIDADTQVIRIK